MARKYRTEALTCPDCLVPLWIRRHKGVVKYYCIKCGQCWTQEKPRVAGPMDVPVKQSEFDFIIDQEIGPKFT